MEICKYTGTFKNVGGGSYDLEVRCYGFRQAFFLLTAKAIGLGRSLPLDSILEEGGRIIHIDEIKFWTLLDNILKQDTMETNKTTNNVYPKREDIEPQTKSDDFRPENNENNNTNEPPQAPEKAE